MTSRALKLQVFLLLIVLLASAMSAFYLKQLFNDGSFWAFDVVNELRWHIEHQYYRYFTLVLQSPAVMAIKLSGSVKASLILFCLGYALYPFISLLIIWSIYRDSEKREFIFILLATFFITIIPNWAFAVSIVNESVALSWLLLGYVVLSKRPSPFLTFLLTACLFFTYESNFLIYSLAGYLLYREKKLTPAHLFILIAASLAQIHHLIVDLIPNNAHQHFKTSLPIAIRGEFFLFAVGVSVVLALAWLQKIPRKFLLLFTGVMVITVISRVLYQNPGALWGMSYFNRTWAIPAAVGIIFLGYEYLRKNNFRFEREMALALLISYLPALLLEARLDIAQRAYYLKLKSDLVGRPGCQVFSFSDWGRFLDGTYAPTWSLPYQSALFNEERRVKSIRFTEMYDHKKKVFIPNRLCENIEGEYRVTDEYATYRIRPLYLNFDFATNN